MSKVGMTVEEPRLRAGLTSRFGETRWLLVYDTDTGRADFHENPGASGRGVAQAMARYSCTDAIFVSIGQEAVTELGKARIRGWWYSGPQLAARELIEKLERGELLWTSGTHPRSIG